MENVLLITIVGMFNLLSFYLALKMNNKTEIVKEKKNVTINPVKIYKTAKERKRIEEEKQKEQEILKANLENIENYDGTPLGQKDIPDIP